MPFFLHYKAIYRESLHVICEFGTTFVVHNGVTPGTHFLIQRGFKRKGENHGFSFDLLNQSLPPQPIIPSNVRFQTLEDLFEGNDAHREQVMHQFYKLFCEILRDVPAIGPTFNLKYDVFKRTQLKHAADFAYNTIALSGNNWIGMNLLCKVGEHSVLWCEMTGVTSEWRGRKIATALKIHGLNLAKSAGMQSVRTTNHSTNSHMIRINKSLGMQIGKISEGFVLKISD